MNEVKKQALAALNELHRTIPYDVYCKIHDGLTEIETLKDRDEELRELWGRFEDVPMNPETECIEEPYLGWNAGVSREEIWHWFDQRYSTGVYHLLYGEGGPHSELFSLMKSCPNLPVLPMVYSDVVCGDEYGWWLGSFGEAYVGEYALYGDRYFKERDDFKEAYYENNVDELDEQFGYEPSLNEYSVKQGRNTAAELEENERNEKLLDEYLDKIADGYFRKAILVYITTPDLEERK